MLFSPEAVIYRGAIENNMNVLRQLCGTSSIMAVVKANAYGHGSAQITEILSNVGCDGYCVATGLEMFDILNSGIPEPVLHLGKVNSEIISKLSSFSNAIFTINHPDDIYVISSSLPADTKAKVHIKVDTGMSRLGVLENNLDRVIEELLKEDRVIATGVFSHFSCSEDLNSKEAVNQFNIFRKVSEYVKSKISSVESAHISNSAGILRDEGFCLDMVRPGISIYGVSPLGEAHKELMPAMRFRAPIVLIKDIPKGVGVGYNSTYVSNEAMQIAMVQAGYADGVPTSLSNQGGVYLNSQSLDIIGKVSMDLICVNLQNNSAEVGDFVDIWGGDFNSLESVSKSAGVLPYHCLTTLSDRVRRVYE